MDPVDVLVNRFAQLEVDNETVFRSADTKKLFELLSVDAGFTGSQGVHFYKAFKCRLLPDGSRDKVKEIVALSLPKCEASERRLTLMQRLAVKDLFPKNYAIFTMEYDHIVFQEKAECDLFDLYEKLNGLHKLPFEEKKQHVRSILKAAVALEENQILHRDIKLENFLVCKNKKIKLTDFGYSCPKDDAKGVDRIPGTAHTLPPELIRWLFLGEKKPEIGFEQDYWSFGLILSLFLTEGPIESESTLYAFADLLDEQKFINKSKNCLNQRQLTKEEADRLNEYLKNNDIKLSPKASSAVRLEKLEERLRKVKAHQAETLRKWSDQIQNLPKKPEKITCLQDIVCAMLQEHPKDRMSPKEALGYLDSIKN